MKFLSAVLAISAIPALYAQVPAAPQAPAPAVAAAPVDPAKVVMTIGTTKITAGQYEDLVNSLPQQYQAYARGAGKRAFAEQMVQLKLLSQEAEKRKLDQDPKLKNELAFQRENLMAQAMFVQMQESAKVDDAAVNKYYDEHKNEYEVVKARHILIRAKDAPMQARPGKPELTDEEALKKAQEIRAKLVKGGDFATLAKDESDDVGSGNSGGDLGEFHRGMMVPPFEQAAFAAKVGDITEPVKTPFGYHLIKVEAHTTKTVADVKAEIETKLRPDIAKANVEAMRKGVAVTLDDGFFGPPEPAAPPAAK